MSYLDDCVELVTKGTTPTSIGGNFTNSGINFLKVESISESGNFIKDKIQFIDQDTHENLLKRSQIHENDILFSIAGTIGRTAIATPEILPCNTNQALAIIRPNLSKVNPYFLLYCLKDKRRLKKAKSNVVQSVQSNLSLSEIKKIEIPKYSLQYQSKISEILKKFDDKIDLNQKMNETLEEIAKTLFKSWFIDFDPVRAKAEGRPTGLSKEISDLFPDSFEDSEFGEIPKSWNLLTFGDFVTPIRGKVITKKTTIPGDIPVVAGGLEPAYFHSIANVEGPVVTISASGANAGYTNLYFEDIWASDCSYISYKQSSNIFTSYIFLNLNQERIFDSQHGAAQPHIYPDDLRRLDMVIPSNDLYATFENLITSFFNKIKSNTQETKNLISLRDALLPKLISGELKIPDAENLVEEAGI